MKTVPISASICILLAQVSPVQGEALPSWQMQRAVSADFGSSASVRAESDESVSVQAIRVHDRKTGEIVQEIGDIGGMPVPNRPDAVVHLVDANGDGRPDVSVAFAAGGAGPNFANQYYLFDGKLGIFALHRQLSALPQPSIGPDGTITSEYRGSCCDHRTETYRFVGGELTLVAEGYESYTPDGKWIDKGVRKLVDGKWRSRRQRIRRRE